MTCPMCGSAMLTRNKPLLGGITVYKYAECQNPICGYVKELLDDLAVSKQRYPMSKCKKVYRVQILKNITVGGTTVSECENEALPGMVYCCEHADREAMGYHIKYLSRLLEEKTDG